jgi:high-affinity nickel-transport protein
MMARLGSRFPMGKAFGVGLVHGLAGSAAIALLVLSAIPNPLWAMLYLAVFGVGTIVGMILITTAIGVPLVMTAERATNFNRTLAVGSGLLSFGFGLFLAYQIGIVDGLFGSVPGWIWH